MNRLNKQQPRQFRRWKPWRMLALGMVMSVAFSGHAQVWSLVQCIDSAQLNNKKLQMDRNAVAISQQRRAEAKSYLIPKVIIGADYKYYFDLPYQLMPMTTFNPAAPAWDYKAIQFGVPHNINANVQLSMPVYNPQVFGAIKTTQIASELSALQYKKDEEQLFFDISNLYYNAQILAHQLAFIEGNLKNTQRLMDNLKLMHEQQMVKSTDVKRIELQHEQLLTQQAMVANNLEQVMNALKFSIGIPFSRAIMIDSAIVDQGIRDYPVSATVEMQLSFMQNKLAASELTTLRRSLLPTVSLVGVYSTVGFGYSNAPNSFLDFYPVSFAGIQLSYPLFNGTVTRRKINQKKLEVLNSNLQTELVRDQNQMLVNNATRKRQVSHQTIKNTDAQIDLATNVYGQLLLQQREGTASLTEVLLADNVLREAQQSNLAAIIDYLKADLELKKQTGNISLKN